MAFDLLDAEFVGETPVAVHDEGDVLGDRSAFQHVDGQPFEPTEFHLFANPGHCRRPVLIIGANSAGQFVFCSPARQPLTCGQHTHNR